MSCPSIPEYGDVNCKTPEEMFKHLMGHLAEGYMVPGYALDRLIIEATVQTNREIAMMCLLERLTAPQMAWQMIDTNTQRDMDTNPCIDIGNGVNTYCLHNPYE